MKRIFLFLLFLLIVFVVVESAFSTTLGRDPVKIDTYTYVKNIADTFSEFPSFDWVLDLPEFSSLEWRTEEIVLEGNFFDTSSNFFRLLWDYLSRVIINIGIIFTWVGNFFASIISFLLKFVPWLVRLCQAFFPGITGFLKGVST